MEIWYKTTLGEVDWQEVADVLRRSGLSDPTAEEQKTAFSNSGAVVFVYDGKKIVGVARALTDGLFQAAIYNVALDEAYQGRGIGRGMILKLLEQLKGQNVILYTHPQTVLLYIICAALRQIRTIFCRWDRIWRHGRSRRIENI